MSLISAIDSASSKHSIGENGHPQLSWGSSLEDINDQICKLFFQIVREANVQKRPHSIESRLIELIKSIHDSMVGVNVASGAGSSPMYDQHLRQLSLLYKMSAQTRDIVAGKGERDLAYAMVLIWFNAYPTLGLELARRFWNEQSERKHPFGSWKDVKYLCEFVRCRTGNDGHSLINFAVREMVAQLKTDYEIMERGKETAISLVARWVPREKSHFGWLFKKIVREMYPEIYSASKKPAEAHRYASMKLRRLLSALNRHLDTTQIKMCGQTWSEIEFNRVTSLTLSKNRLAFANTKKNKTRRSDEEDRILCAEHLKAHMEAAKSGDASARVHGKRLSVYEMVRDVMSHSAGSLPEDVKTLINLQWADNATTNGALGNIIPMVDTSASMTANNSIPLFSAIGLGIRVSECTHPAFRNRIMTFSAKPTWVNLEHCSEFTDKVYTVSKAEWGANTNFYAAMTLILNAIVENDVSPDEVASLTLAVFSDMQIDAADKEVSRNGKGTGSMTMFERVREMFEEAGLRSKYGVPYKPPHILFWNLRSTDGFPVASSTPNTTMMSGFSSVLLNAFCNKGVDALCELTPFKMLEETLDNERYAALEDIVLKAMFVK